jgi:hypothetical protein
MEINGLGQPRTLRETVRVPKIERVKFDPANPEHRRAYEMLMVGGRIHPTLRFETEAPFVDILSMMERKISLYACQELAVA